MGTCFSQDYAVRWDDFSPRAAHPTAKVVSSSGHLREYALPVTVARVLLDDSGLLFLCDSDKLCYDQLIPEMGSDEELVKGHMYFALPRSRLVRPLSASNMASLAVKASIALQKAATSSPYNVGRKQRRRKSRISPVFEVISLPEEVAIRKGSDTVSSGNKPRSPQPQPSPPVRRLRRSSSSRKLNKAVQSFRVRLSTIQEGPELLLTDQCIRS